MKPKETQETAENPKLWIIEVENMCAHIYERTTDGTQWIGDAYVADGRLSLATPRQDNCHPLPDLPEARQARDSRQFLARFADWLDYADSQREFDKAVLVAAEPTMVDLQPALSKQLNSRIKLASDEILIKNESEDRLARVMWL